MAPKHKLSSWWSAAQFLVGRLKLGLQSRLLYLPIRTSTNGLRTNSCATSAEGILALRGERLTSSIVYGYLAVLIVAMGFLTQTECIHLREDSEQVGVQAPPKPDG